MSGDRELAKLIDDLQGSPERMLIEGRRVLQKGSLNIKNDWRQRWSGHPRYRMLPYAITYDTRITATTAESQIGPDKDRPQGALGNIIEFGTENNAPLPGGLPALQAEEPRYLQALAEAAERAVLP